MYTLFPLLYTYDDDDPAASKDYRGNWRNESRLVRAILRRDFDDMLVVQAWLKGQCKLGNSSPWPFDHCAKHDTNCRSYDEFVMTAGLGHLIRILHGQAFDYVEHLEWVQTHKYHSGVATRYFSSHHSFSQ
ncbi:hypothetical protein PG994_005437 [Apiospora phragmitis]|uniref:Uncharacterized protein n=1 Tax=Apiospora phragmitis TaxID=2905665 RepID=A0ABR1VC79_9PEZI